MKFGISFNLTAFNQAGALVHVYKDGSVLINHGGTEMGQGLHTKMLQVAATTLGVPLAQGPAGPDPHRQGAEHLRDRGELRAPTSTARAVKNACEQIRDRLAPVAAERLGISPADVRFVDGSVRGLSATREVVRGRARRTQAYFQRVQLWAAGFYRTEGLHWDSTRMQGEPFKYFAYGAAATEVEVDGFTGAYRIAAGRHRARRGRQPVPAGRPRSDRGRVRAGRGLAHPRGPALGRDATGRTRGRLTTQAASTYKLPSFSEMPEVFNVALLEHADRGGRRLRLQGGRRAAADAGLLGARGAAPGRGGLRACPDTSVDLASPATPEAVYWAVEQARHELARGHVDEGGLGVEPEQPDPNAPPIRPYSERMQHVSVRA